MSQFAYTARGLIDQARSLSDLQNSKNITYTDGINLLNEAYREMYSRYTESSGDYYLSEYVFTLTPAMADPNQANGTSYLVDLPTDFYKVRFVDYNLGGTWYPVDIFSSSQRNLVPSRPRYRLKNGKLWLLLYPGSASQFRLSYYTPPQALYFPDDPIIFAKTSPVYDYANFTFGHYSVSQKCLFYIYNGNTIKVENQVTGTVKTLYTSANPIKKLNYYSGYLYWLNTTSGTVFRAQTDLVSTLSPVSIITPSVTDFNLQNAGIYFSTATMTYRCGLDGTGTVLVFPSPSIDFQMFNGIQLFINPANHHVKYDSVESTQNALAVLQYGAQAFCLTDTNALVAINFDAAKVLSVGATVLPTVLAIGKVDYTGHVPVYTPTAISVESMVLDSVLDYPTNDVNEILAYYVARAFSRKGMDSARVEQLGKDLDMLWTRFWDVNKRDEYQNQRVNDGYNSNAWQGYW